MRAHQENKANIGHHNIPMDVAMDPKNAWKFVTKVETDFAAQTLGADQTAYYKQWDVDPEHPVNRAGHMWSVRLKE